jgi:putative transposase
MPSRNEIKEALPAATYHAYNRGVERRQIFMDGHDYRRFAKQMRQCLDREPGITLLAYCLMPNHFHLLLQQTDATAMSRFLQRLTIGYVMYFNKRHRRIGPLFQGKYKAVRIIGPNQLMEVSRYIHLNPERAGLGWRHSTYSSINSYVDPTSEDELVNPRPILDLFDQPSDYKYYLSIGELRS